MARMHNQASAWNLPTGFTRHAWDTDGLVGELPFWGRFWELDSLTRVERELILRGRNRVRTELSALDRGHDSYSMIHADFTPENLLMDNLGLRPIDFDDAGFGWHLFDLATALFFHQEETYYSAAQEAMISGYRTRRSLPEAVLSHLPLFMVARSFTYLGWLHTRQETQTAKDMAPLVTDICCHLTRHYLGEPKNSN